MALVLDDTAEPTRGRRSRARGRRGGHPADRDLALRRITGRIRADQDLEHVQRIVVAGARTLFGADVTGLWLHEQGARPLRLAAHEGLSAELIEAVSKITRRDDLTGVRAIVERGAVAVEEPEHDPHFGDIYGRMGVRTVMYVPLVAGEESVGLLILGHLAPFRWDDTGLDLCAAFAGQMAAAVSTARLSSSVRTGAERLRAIQELSARLNRIQDVEGIGEAIVAGMDRLIRHDTIRVYRVDDASQSCEPVAFQGEFMGIGRPTTEMLRLPVGSGLTGWVARHNAPVRLGDAASDPRSIQVGERRGAESILVVPMSWEDRVMGVIVVSTEGHDQYTDDDERMLEIFAGYAAQALANAEAFGEIRRQRAELQHRLESQRRLLEVNERLLSTLDPGGVLEMIADSLKAVVAYDALTIYRIDWATRRRRAVVARDRYAELILRHESGVDDGLTGWAVRNGEAVLANDAHLDPRVMQIPGTPEDPESMIVCPLIVGSVTVGTLNVSRTGGEESHFTRDEFEQVQLFAAQASIALRNAEAHGEVGGGRAIVIDDYAEYSGRAPDLAGGEFGAVCAVPLTSSDEVVGLIGLASGDTGRSFSEREMGALARFAQLASVALDNGRLFERTQTEVRQRTHAALHDTLTGLPNRTLLLNRLADQLQPDGRLGASRESRSSGARVALVLLDLDRFTLVNETLGHAVGDLLLKEVARRVVGAARTTDTVARLGSDEFGVLLGTVRSVREAERVALRIERELAVPFDLGGREVQITASLGLAIGRTSTTNPNDLLREAEIALHRSKADLVLGTVLFDPEMRAQTLERAELEHDLRRAIERRELRLHYQPLVSLASGTVVGMEALLRWQHPTRGLIPPLSFIPLAEETGLILPIGRWVLETACTQFRDWQRRLPAAEGLALAVNISARQFAQSDLVGTVAQILDHTGIAPARLELEITESVVMDQSEASVARFQGLRGLGVRLVLDDFGTGYSSLAYLRRLPLDTIKIDRSFVSGLAEEPVDRPIVKTVIALAHGLGVDVVAEGIETQTQLEELRALGCGRGQGYWFARPLPVDEMERLLSGASGREVALPG